MVKILLARLLYPSSAPESVTTHFLRMIINLELMLVLMFELNQNLGQEIFCGKRDYCES